MIKKQKITENEIKKDIITALKHPYTMNKVSYKKTIVCARIIICLLLAIIFISTKAFLWTFYLLLVFGFGYVMFYHFRLKIKIKNLSVDDYNITIETVSSVSEDHYRELNCGRFINNFVIHFENEKNWRIPKFNYLWNTDHPVSDSAVYQSIHRADSMIVVTNKDTDEIIVAYHTDFFEYKN